MAPGRVLSLQSHVVHGYVGNRAAVFPLQLLGFEVDFLNSVQFSCHTGYPAIRGPKLSGDDLRELVEGLTQNEVLDHEHLLTGYIGTASFLREVVALRKLLPEGSRYICDPVLGDNGKLYTTGDLVDVYREEVLPVVTMLTPNQFEAELLTKDTIKSVADAAAACDKLHKMGPPTVVITTLDVPDATLEGKMVAMMLSQAGGRKWLLRLPYIAGGPFTGTGDLTAAMLLAWTALYPHEAPEALERAGAILQSVIQTTVSLDSARMIGGKLVPPELRIINCKRAIEEPRVAVRCELLEPVGLRAVICVFNGNSHLPDGIDDFFEELSKKGVKGGVLVREAQILRFVCGLPNVPDITVDNESLSCKVVEHCSRQWDLQPSSMLTVAAEPGHLVHARAAGCVTAALLPEQGTQDTRQSLVDASEFAMSSVQALRRLVG